MRVLLTAAATTALVVSGPLTANAAGQGSQGPVGGDQLTTKPTVVADGATPPVVQASAYVVADLDTGAVLAAKAPHAKQRPASTLKTLTALVLLPRLNKNDVVTGTDADAGIEGSKVGVYPGLRYSVDLLFQGMFLASGNDAVHALSAHDQGGIPATVQRMNQKAKEIGALDTTVTEPDFAKYASTKYTNFPNAGNKGTYQVANQNKLLFNYDGALGVKTGYTTLARNTFIGAARRNGHTLVVTLMNAPHGITEDASNLLTWGFKNYDQLHPVGMLVKPGDAPPKVVTGPTDKKAGSGTTHPPRSRTVLNPGQALQSLQSVALRVPAWAYAAPPVLLLSLFLRRPRALRMRRH